MNRILYTTASGSPQSGASRMLLSMVNAISDYGISPILLLPNDSSTVKDVGGGIHVEEAPIPLPNASRSLPFLAKDLMDFARSINSMVALINEKDIELIHLNEIFDVYGAMAAKVAGVPCVWHVRANLEPWWLARLALPRIALKLADAVIVVSESVKIHEFRSQGINTSKIHIVHDPRPDQERFSPNCDGRSVRKEIGIADDGFLITLVAKLSRRKGHAVLIRAIPEILNNFPQSKFLLVGGEIDGKHHREYAEEIKALPSKIGVGDNVVFAGFRDDIPQIMAASEVIIHCSTYPDPFPGIVLQGMAMGKPVIASKMGGPLEQIEDGESGILVDPGDESALAAAICQLLSNEQQRIRIGQCGLRRLRIFPNTYEYAERLLDIYQEVLSQDAQADLTRAGLRDDLARKPTPHGK